METVIRLSSAVVIFLVMAGCERWRPRRALELGPRRRWPVNLGLAAFNMMVMALTIGSFAYLAAVHAEQHGLGLLNRLNLPAWLATAISLILLDFALYIQHVAMHKWPLLWRLHQVHHTDLEFDVTTAVRFHPLEIVVSMLYKIVLILLIGAPPVAVVLFEIILNGAATFNHSNAAIAPSFDRKLRWLIITPDMHRIHHSARREETDSNYGFSISVWDRLCGTYTGDPHEPQTQMAIGLAAYRKPDELGFSELLRLPFTRQR